MQFVSAFLANVCKWHSISLFFLDTE